MLVFFFNKQKINTSELVLSMISNIGNYFKFSHIFSNRGLREIRIN